MKKLVEVAEDGGLESYMGQRVTLYCCRFFYTGELIGVSDDCVVLKGGGIVYDTGDFKDKEWKNYQKLPHDWCVARQSIESFGIMKWITVLNTGQI